MVEWVFWGAGLLLLHTYVLYPLLLKVGNRLLPSRYARPPVELAPGEVEQASLPRVTLVVAAHNEEAVIARKLENSLALDYPPELLEIVIGSDGSTDRTDAIVRACTDPRVRLDAAPRAGKVGVLNRTIPLARGEIVLLSDANTHLEPDALRRLVPHFDDPSVGAVCGRLRLYNPTKQDFEESAYWTYESAIKLEEGRRGALIGANGGLYALRRVLFSPLPPDTIVDDFVIPLRVLEQGKAVVYEEKAVALEETTEDYGREFGRRARIAAGNFQALTLVPRLLLPSAGFAAYAFWSHKVIRWCAPLLMGLCLMTNLMLLGSGGMYVLLFLLQLAFYGLAAWGHRNGIPESLGRLVSVPYYFVSMNVAIAVGFLRFLKGTQKATWERTARA
jgi:cellulose synthase/poly-beta-1,6-N-acetylglucosamine synthase-like glycosyltransferase